MNHMRHHGPVESSDLSRAIRSAGGQLVGGGRIPSQLLQEAVEAAEAAKEGVPS